MAKTETKPEPVKTGDPIGAYRLQGGGFATFDAIGKTRIVSQEQAERAGIKEVK